SRHPGRAGFRSDRENLTNRRSSDFAEPEGRRQNLRPENKAPEVGAGVRHLVPCAHPLPFSAANEIAARGAWWRRESACQAFALNRDGVAADAVSGETNGQENCRLHQA